MTQLKSQILGLSLALLTAIGTIGYERVVKKFSYAVVVIGLSCELILLILFYSLFMNGNIKEDCQKLFTTSGSIGWFLLWVGSAFTSVLWYQLTKYQGVMTASLYEVKFIVVLAVIYACFGANKFSINTLIGMVLTLLAIYFISKS